MNGAPVDTPIRRVTVQAFRIPTETPESDGTFEWQATTLVLVEIEAGAQRGLGYTYGSPAIARLIGDALQPRLVGTDAYALPGWGSALYRQLRNDGLTGLSMMALSAVDIALWDLRAKLLQLPLCRLLGAERNTIAAYGSGGFTSYDQAHLCSQLAGWCEAGYGAVKMKVGRAPAEDAARVQAVRRAIGDDCELFVDANGAYSTTQALELAQVYADHGVSWFEEPVSSNDRNGLSLLRRRLPPGMDLAAGEYAYAPRDFLALIQSSAVDVMQADATRCGGISGLLSAAALCAAHELPMSTHCAPAVHVQAACALQPIRHVEAFFDHLRIESLLFDGVPACVDGQLAPDLTRPGLGLEFKRAKAEAYAR